MQGWVEKQANNIGNIGQGYTLWVVPFVETLQEYWPEFRKSHSSVVRYVETLHKYWLGSAISTLPELIIRS